MEEKVPHKFQEKMELTYEEFFRARYDRAIQLARELEQVLGRQKAFEIISKACQKYAVESVKKQMEERKPIKNFEDFKAFMKEEQKSGRWSHIVTRTLTEEKPNELIIHSSECLIAKMFKEMNAVDLGLIMCCNTDFATARIYHPQLKLRRTKTLMKDDYCEKIYYWK